jgi:glycosyltransferase involved in cell wall biosynthesis
VITTRANGFSEIIESGVHGQILDQGDEVTALQQAIENWIDPDHGPA